MYVIKPIYQASCEALTQEVIYGTPTHLWLGMTWARAFKTARTGSCLHFPALFSSRLSSRLLGLPTERQSLLRTSFCFADLFRDFLLRDEDTGLEAFGGSFSSPGLCRGGVCDRRPSREYIFTWVESVFFFLFFRNSWQFMWTKLGIAYDGSEFLLQVHTVSLHGNVKRNMVKTRSLFLCRIVHPPLILSCTSVFLTVPYFLI